MLILWRLRVAGTNTGPCLQWNNGHVSCAKRLEVREDAQRLLSTLINIMKPGSYRCKKGLQTGRRTFWSWLAARKRRPLSRTVLPVFVPSRQSTSCPTRDILPQRMVAGSPHNAMSWRPCARRAGMQVGSVFRGDAVPLIVCYPGLSIALRQVERLVMRADSTHSDSHHCCRQQQALHTSTGASSVGGNFW